MYTFPSPDLPQLFSFIDYMDFHYELIIVFLELNGCTSVQYTCMHYHFSKNKIQVWSPGHVLSPPGQVKFMNYQSDWQVVLIVLKKYPAYVVIIIVLTTATV